MSIIQNYNLSIQKDIAVTISTRNENETFSSLFVYCAK